MTGLFFRVAGLGIEPKFSLSESDVLPLDDPAIYFLGDLETIISSSKNEVSGREYGVI